MPGLPVLPADLRFARVTTEFTEQSVPAGLLHAHRTAPGVWGHLVVRDGTVGFVFDDDPDNQLTVRSGDTVAIQPQRPHHVVPVGAVRFAVEFYRAIDDPSDPTGPTDIEPVG